MTTYATDPPDPFRSLHMQMAQRGRLFKREPQTVVRELPRATGLRALVEGDVVRDRVYPDLIYRVARIVVCPQHGQHVTLWDDEHRTHRDALLGWLSRGYEHADGAGIEVRP